MSAYTTCNLLKKPNIMHTPSGIKTNNHMSGNGCKR